MAKRRVKLSPLRDVLAYRNAEVVNRFLAAWDVSKAEANELFRDMLRFLWASARHPELVPVPIVDEMWHTFLVYTRSYREFSLRYFGKMRDHEPRTGAEVRARVKALQRSPVEALRSREAELERDVSAVYDCFGAKVTSRWYVDYKERFGPRFFETGRRTKTRPPQHDDAAMIAASEAFFAALDRVDAAALEQTVSSSFVMFTNERCYDFAGMVAARSGSSPTRTWHHARCFAGDTSVVFVGRATEHLDGESALDRVGWHTLVWIRDGATWKVSHYQFQRADADAERNYWNHVYRLGVGFTPEPNRALVEAVTRRPPGAALDLMMGQGRNAIFLAEHGWKVTGVDVSDVGVRIVKAAAEERQLAIDAIEADVHSWDLGTDLWDLVTLVYGPGTVELVERVKRSLKKGGLFVTEYFHGEGIRELAPLLETEFRIVHANVVEDVADFGRNRRRLERVVAEKR